MVNQEAKVSYSDRENHIRGVLLVLIGSSLWGISGTVAQYLFQAISFPMDLLVMLRLCVSGTLILLYLKFIKKRPLFAIWKDKQSRLQLLAFSTIGMLGVQYAYFAAIKYGNAATATILQYLSPVIIAIFLAVRWRKMPNRTVVIAIGFAVIGTFLIVTSGNVKSLSISGLAFFWGIMSAITAAFYTVQPQKLLKGYGALQVVGWGMFIGGLLFALIYKPWEIGVTLSVNVVVAVLFVVLFGTLLAFTLYLESTRYITPTETSVLSSAEPLSAAVLSVTWLHNQLSLIQWFGMGLVVLTIMILTRAQKKTSE